MRFGFLIPWLILIAGGGLLQVFLSTRESKWPGTGLPIVTFGISLVILLAALVYPTGGAIAAFIENRGIMMATEGVSASAIRIGGLLTFLVLNIPTGIFLAIYALCRRKLCC